MEDYVDQVISRMEEILCGTQREEVRASILRIAQAMIESRNYGRIPCCEVVAGTAPETAESCPESRSTCGGYFYRRTVAIYCLPLNGTIGLTSTSSDPRPLQLSVRPPYSATGAGSTRFWFSVGTSVSRFHGLCGGPRTRGVPFSFRLSSIGGYRINSVRRDGAAFQVFGVPSGFRSVTSACVGVSGTCLPVRRFRNRQNPPFAVRSSAFEILSRQEPSLPLQFH